jgi:chromosome segregation ATPase
MITERATLLRYERERQDVTLRQIESIHALLQEERGLYQSVDDPNPDSLIRQQALTRRIEEIVAQIAASRQEIRALDDTLQRLEERLPKTGRAP